MIKHHRRHLHPFQIGNRFLLARAHQKNTGKRVIPGDIRHACAFFQPHIAEQIAVFSTDLLHFKENACVTGGRIVIDIILISTHDE